MQTSTLTARLAAVGNPARARIDIVDLLAVAAVAVAVRLGALHRDIHPAFLVATIVLASAAALAALHSRPLGAVRTRAGTIDRGLLVGAVACLLAVLALVQVAWMLFTLLHVGEVEYGEAILYDHAARLLRGEPLYQPLNQPPYTVATYTPVYYWSAAAARFVFGPGFLPGRVLSCLAALATAALVGHLASSRTSRRPAGLFAAVLFVALGCATNVPWTALYKEDALGVAFGVGAVVLLVREPRTRTTIVAGAVLAALAILTKQSLFGAAVAGTIWLWTRQRNAAVLFGGTCLLLVVGAAAMLEMSTGAFIRNTVVGNLNPWSWDAFVSNFDLLAEQELGPIAAAAVYAVVAARGSAQGRPDLLIVYWLISALPVVGMAKVGAHYNYWLEFASCTAVLATLAIWAAPSDASSSARPLLGALPLLLLAGSLVMVAPRISPAVLSGLRSVPDQPERSAEFGQLVQLVHDQRGDVLAQPQDVLALADRPVLLDIQLMSVLEGQQVWDPRPLVARICGGQVGLLVVSSALEDQASFTFQKYPLWPPSVSRALLQVMRFDQQLAGRFVYKPAGACPSQ